MACLRHPSPRHQPEAFSRWLQDTVKAEAIDCVIPVYEETFHHGLNHGLLDCDHFCSDIATLGRLHNKFEFIELANNSLEQINGRGDVRLGALDENGILHIIKFKSAAQTDSGDNLIDVDQMISAGFNNPDLQHRVWEHSSGIRFPLVPDKKPATWRLYRLH